MSASEETDADDRKVALIFNRAGVTAAAATECLAARSAAPGVTLGLRRFQRCRLLLRPTRGIREIAMTRDVGRAEYSACPGHSDPKISDLRFPNCLPGRSSVKHVDDIWALAICSEQSGHP